MPSILPLLERAGASALGMFDEGRVQPSCLAEQCQNPHTLV
jgi:hypothetical protein